MLRSRIKSVKRQEEQWAKAREALDEKVVGQSALSLPLEANGFTFDQDKMLRHLVVNNNTGWCRPLCPVIGCMQMPVPFLQYCDSHREGNEVRLEFKNGIEIITTDESDCDKSEISQGNESESEKNEATQIPIKEQVAVLSASADANSEEPRSYKRPVEDDPSQSASRKRTLLERCVKLDTSSSSSHWESSESPQN